MKVRMESQLDTRAFPFSGKIEGEYNLAFHEFYMSYFPRIELE
jgi:hypothetical protein